MASLEFRKLKADEIECRIGQIKIDRNGEAVGLSLLLYKDARSDMNILDETVGKLNWKREHLRDNKNCVVSIWDEDKGQWISKEDVGVESNTEAEKGLASDSFKRACVNWGIGRELYSSPFIWIKADKCNISVFNGKGKCYDKFRVEKISYSGEEIDGLSIWNDSKDTRVFVQMPKEKEEPKDE